MTDRASVAEALCEFIRSSVRDPGVPYALDMMQHYILGGGNPFHKGPGRDVSTGLDWDAWMAGRPEIHERMGREFSQLIRTRGATLLARAERAPVRFSLQLRGLRLFMLQSMRLVLHGCHRLEVTGQLQAEYIDRSELSRIQERVVSRMSRDPRHRSPRRREITEARACAEHVRISQVSFCWVDRAQLHNSVDTELDSGRLVHDQAFEALQLGQEYDVRIRFRMPRDSVWFHRQGQGTLFVSGWPDLARVQRCRDATAP